MNVDGREKDRGRLIAMCAGMGDRRVTDGALRWIQV